MAGGVVRLLPVGDAVLVFFNPGKKGRVICVEWHLSYINFA